VTSLFPVKRVEAVQKKIVSLKQVIHTNTGAIHFPLTVYSGGKKLVFKNYSDYKAHVINLIVKTCYKPLFKNSVAPSMALAHLEQESDFNPFAVSSKGAVGLMQVTPVALKEVNNKLGLKLKKSQLLDLEYNTTAGIAYLSLLKKYYLKKKWFASLPYEQQQLIRIGSYNYGLKPKPQLALPISETSYAKKVWFLKGKWQKELRKRSYK